MKLNSDWHRPLYCSQNGRSLEINDEGSGKKLKWLYKTNGQHRIGTIIKIAKDELHIKEPGSSGLLVWKRIQK
jgi:hypothetical protein